MKRKIENIKSSMKSTLEKSAAEVGMNPKRVKFPFSPEDREKYLKYENRVDNISKNLKKEQVDLYDLILSHLLDEGYAYAETPEAAEVMMVNMSEEWRDSIMEGYKERPIKKMIKKAMDIVNRPEYEGSSKDVWRHNQILRHTTKNKGGGKQRKKAQHNLDKYWDKIDREEEK